MKHIRTILLAIGLASLLLVGAAIAYFTDTEGLENVVTIGKVDLSLSEGDPWDSSSTPPVVVPGKKVDKAPMLSNTGKNDEYVFFEITMPKEKVRMLYEEDTTIGAVTHLRGTPIDTDASYQEIFRTIASGSNTEYVTDGANEFQYHVGNSSEEGWIYLGVKSETDTEIIYSFGYNRMLKASESSTHDETITLFDQIQLKSFIDEEVLDDENNAKSERIEVLAYGIQADNLNIDIAGAFLTKSELNSIYSVVKEKKG